MLKKICVLLLAVLMLAVCLTWAEEQPAATEVPSREPGNDGAGDGEEPLSAPAEEPAAPRKLIALTFDDGPDALMTAPVLDVLEEYGVRATFFLCGNKINEKTAPLVDRAISLGCEIGCHGWDHRTMTKVSKEMTVKQVGQFRKALEKYVSVPVSVMLVRPPGGHSNGKVRVAASEVGMAIIIWDVDSADWKVQKKEAITDTVLSKVKDGSIILMHDRHQPTPDALRILIPALLEQGYEFVTVSELLTRNGDPIEPGAEYRCMPPAPTPMPTSVG